MRGDRIVCLDLRGENGGEGRALEPFLDAIQFAALSRAVAQQVQQNVQCIEDDHRSAHFLGVRFESRQHGGQVELTDLDRVRTQLRIQNVETLLLPSVDVPAETPRVGADAFRIFLEGDEDAGRIVTSCSANQSLERQDRLAAAGSTQEQRRASLGKSSGGDIIEAADAAGHLL